MHNKCDIDQSVVVSAYASGLSMKKIGEMFGVSKIPIKRILLEAGVEITKKNVIPNRDEKAAETVRLYREGLPIPEIVKITGVSNKNTAMFLRDAGVVTRRSSDYPGAKNGRKELDASRIAAEYSDGASVNSLARKYGVGFSTIWRTLRSVDVNMRPVSSVPTHTLYSPCAGRIRVRGSWELTYAKVLDIWASEGKISGWKYEAEKVFLPDGRYYLPDFSVFDLAGCRVFHEVKGILHQSAEKKIIAARSLGHPVVMVRRKMLLALRRHYGTAVDVS